MSKSTTILCRTSSAGSGSGTLNADEAPSFVVRSFDLCRGGRLTGGGLGGGRIGIEGGWRARFAKGSSALWKATSSASMVTAFLLCHPDRTRLPTAVNTERSTGRSRRRLARPLTFCRSAGTESNWANGQDGHKLRQRWALPLGTIFRGVRLA